MWTRLIKTQQLRDRLARITNVSPGLAAGLHVVGEVDIVRPDVVLPLPQPQHSAEDSPAVDPDPHVEVHVSSFHHGPEQDHVTDNGRKEGSDSVNKVQK